MSRYVTAAEQLLKIADSLEKEAAEKTLFACSGCGHTASLEEINDSIKKHASKVASEGGEFDLNSSLVTVNDRVRCASCKESAMAYVATPESEKFYMDEPKKKEEKAEGEEKESKEEVDLLEGQVMEASMEAQAGLLDSFKKGVDIVKNIADKKIKVDRGTEEKAEEVINFMSDAQVQERDLKEAENMLTKVKPQDMEFVYDKMIPGEELEARFKSFETQHGPYMTNALRVVHGLISPEHDSLHLAASSPVKGLTAALLMMIGTAMAGQGKSINMDKYLPGFSKAENVLEELSKRPVDNKLNTYEQKVVDNDGNEVQVNVPGDEKDNAKDVATKDNPQGWEFQASERVNKEKLASYLA